MLRTKDPDFSLPHDGDEFYEVMPLATMPHSIYRDDPADYYHPDTADESNQTVGRLTALVTLALLMISAIGLLIFIMYGFSSLSDQAASANSSGTSSNQ